MLASLWPFGSGSLKLPKEETLFLPQRPYLPISSFYEIFSYPFGTDAYGMARIESVVTDVGLGKFLGEGAVICDWSKRLSPGEQQRVSIGRAILINPKCLFLDEALSNLDPTSRSELITVIRQKLANTSIISIQHDEIGNDQNTWTIAINT